MQKEMGVNTKAVEEKAKEIFGEDGLFCAESVLTAVAEESGLISPIIPRIATGFCGGIARTSGMCGAVSGGIMAIGLLFGRDNAEQSNETAYKKVQQFLHTFKKEYKSINCSDLIGVDLSKEEDRKIFIDKGMMKNCRQFTGKAAGMVAALIADGKSDEV